MESALEFTACVQQISHAMSRIKDLLSEPTAMTFHRHEQDFLELFTVTNSTDTVHAAFAYAAQEAAAFRKLGCRNTSDYLAQVLQTSKYQARQWLALGMNLYAPPEEPEEPEEPNPESEQSAPGREGAEAERRQQEEDELAARRRRHEERERRKREQELARKKAKRLSDEKLKEINREVEHLHDSLRAEHLQRLQVEAMAEAEHRGVDDLRMWVRGRVRDLNRKVVDPLAGHRARKVRWGKPDSKGNVHVTAVLPRMGHALLETLLASARLAQWERARGEDVDNDQRTLEQRRADALLAMLQKWASDQDAGVRGDTRGLASLVVAVTAKDLEAGQGVAGPSADGNSGVEPDSGSSGGSGRGTGAAPRSEMQSEMLPTNTAADLHPLDILRLGLAEYDLGVLLDADTGRAVDAGRVRRHASVKQKLMLVAEQLCCVYPGCTRSACESDVHHLIAWSRGGRTDVENMALLCRYHHQMNRDARDGGGMGHADVGPDGRVGWREPNHVSGEVRMNESTVAQRAPGYRIAKER
ncbi:MAG TPA: HNH endonuclease [Candidatus Corynebacterium gallistercoris]|uniref:HNH endonuclease n=1 Tax=Candidatus Corynebacterium gallistercoris TaxID=2838530 RepID=A0A9D1UPU7_9CORY|nr:HNH endonuclease [Candidatus Corynebacterium gallistercoris]